VAADTSNSSADGMQPDGQEQFGIQKVYVKDLSFEAPNAPQIFMTQAPMNPRPPELELSYSTSEVAPNLHEVVLNITLTFKVDDKTAFIIEVKQAGIFVLMGFPKDRFDYMLNGVCPNALFPYARETVTDISTRGGFQPFFLPAINFEAMYMQHLSQAQAKKQPVDTSQIKITLN